jgi:CRISPR-associated protein Cmr6
MPVAAVPAYLCQDFKDASPGMRFGMYLPIWTERADQEAEVHRRAEAKSREGDEVKALLNRGMDFAIQQLRNRPQKALPGLWDKNDFAAKDAWKQVIRLSNRDKDTMKALQSRLTAAFTASVAETDRMALEAIATAPFTTGLGNEHPLENGFAFLNPYGLPYLPGSGVKGVLRQAARELASGEWGDTRGWTAEKIHLVGHGRDAINFSAIDALFGMESVNGGNQHLRGALTFWDLIPQIKGDALAVDIMTPHQSHYYQQKRDHKAGDSTSPHDAGQPNPISFLTVPAGSGFSFHVTCDLTHLENLAPDLAANERWKAVLTAAFEHAFQWLGFGAKTSVGYGAMLSESQRKRELAQARARQEQEAARQREAALERQEASAQPWSGAQIKFNRANGALTVTKDGKQAVATAPKGKELLDSLPQEIRRKIETNQFVRVTAFVAESTLVKVQA